MPTLDPTKGAAYAFTEQFLGGPTLETDNTYSVGTSVKLIAGNRSDRVGLVIVNMGTGVVYTAPNPAVSSSNGIVLGANGGSVTLNLRDDFTLQARDWYAISDNGGPYNVYVLEVARFNVTVQQ